MENNGHNKGLTYVLVFIGILVVFVISGYLINSEMKLKKTNHINDNVDSTNSDTSKIDDKNTESKEFKDYNLAGVEIQNKEVEELYSIVQASLKSNSVCQGYYYQNPFSSHDLKDKIGLLLVNDTNLEHNKFDVDLSEKTKKITGESLDIKTDYYIKGTDLRNELKRVFNIDVDEIESGSYPLLRYIKDLDIFISGNGGGGYFAKPLIVPIEYVETTDEITIREVKAEVTEDKIYRYVNKKDTLVYDNFEGEFKFTEDNINNFPQLKYVFKKNEQGNYYLSDIVNLNYSSDYETCDY